MNRKGCAVRTAFILGAGLGIRMRPLTEHYPKPLLQIGGRPMITYAMEHLLSVGIERFIVNTHHCSEAYDEAFRDRHWRGVPVFFRYEPILLDTAGGLKNIEDLLDADERLLVYNGDILTDLPLRKLVEDHLKKQAEVTLALRSSGTLLNVNIDQSGWICDLRGLLGDPGVKRYQFTGIYMVERRFLNRLTPGRIESVVPVFAGMIREHPQSVAGVVIDEGRWQDLGSVEEYEKVKRRRQKTGIKKSKV
jgi:NDP-sugar pyrophosphorylase family protein